MLLHKVRALRLNSTIQAWNRNLKKDIIGGGQERETEKKAALIMRTHRKSTDGSDNEAQGMTEKHNDDNESEDQVQDIQIRSQV